MFAFLVPLPLLAQMEKDSLAYTMSLDDLEVIDFRSQAAGLNNTVSLHGVNSFSTTSLGDAINNTSSIYFKDYSFNGIKTIDLRGTGASRTQVFWNGMPLNSPMLGQFDFSLLPTYFLGQVRIRYGSESIQDGGGGLGGSIHMQNPLDFDQNKVGISLGLGSFGQRMAAGFAQFKSGNLRSETRLYYNVAQNDFPFTNEFKKDNPQERRNHNESEQKAIQQLLEYAMNKNHSVGFKFFATALDRNIPSSSAVNREGAHQVDEMILGQLNWKWLIGSRAYFKVRSGYQEQINTYTSTAVDLAENVWKSWNNHIVSGYSPNEWLDFTASMQADRISASSFGAGQIDQWWTTGWFQSRFQVSKSIELIAGVRTYTQGDQYSPPIAYGAAHLFLPERLGKISIQVAQIYRFPTLNDRYWDPGGNPELRPERGESIDVSYANTRKLGMYKIGLELKGYYGVIHDWILWYPDESGAFWIAQNLRKVNNRGLEAALLFKRKIRSFMILSIAPSYAFTQAIELPENEKSIFPEGDQLRLVPMHQARLPIRFEWKLFETFVNYGYTGMRTIGTGSSSILDPFHRLDAGVVYHSKNERYELGTSFYNLLDQQYQTIPGQPLPGFHFQIQLNIFFL
jgi:vitamin B12 transporter